MTWAAYVSLLIVIGFSILFITQIKNLIATIIFSIIILVCIILGFIFYNFKRYSYDIQNDSINIKDLSISPMEDYTFTLNDCTIYKEVDGVHNRDQEIRSRVKFTNSIDYNNGKDKSMVIVKERDDGWKDLIWITPKEKDDFIKEIMNRCNVVERSITMNEFMELIKPE